MDQSERVYSVLIVSSSKSFLDLMAENLPEAGFSPVHTAPTISAARRKTGDFSYDFIFINSPLSDDIGTRFAIDICSTSVVLLLVNSEIYEDINYKVSKHGVFTLAKPFSKAMISTAINWMASAREIINKSQKKTSTVEEKMSEIRAVNRAKWLLINELNMSEPEAHRYIGKQAMDRCVSKGTVANEIINTYT
ncbi:MAG: ANTAR domain-containing protein [Lachnospiraceae bacterium]|nr:ANTAR domain-containing protein [Lachnospiraceae bacterium]